MKKATLWQIKSKCYSQGPPYNNFCELASLKKMVSSDWLSVKRQIGPLPNYFVLLVQGVTSFFFLNGTWGVSGQSETSIMKRQPTQKSHFRR